MNVTALQSLRFPSVEQTYGAREASLYALSVGCGSDPMDLGQLQYVYGKTPRALSSMGLVLATPGFWLMDTDVGVDWTKVVLARQSFKVFKPLPPAGKVRSQLRIAEVVDCGRERGALIGQARDLLDAATGEILATIEHCALARGNGGFDPQHQKPMPSVTMPARAPDARTEIATLPQAALLFDLHGIVNPIHSWPPAARQAGFPRPILHGLCTMGTTHHALVKALAGYDGDKVPEMSMNFMKPVFPGDVLRVSCWLEPDHVLYAVEVPAREQTVAKGSARLLEVKQ